jgi:hypothetical protein
MLAVVIDQKLKTEVGMLRECYSSLQSWRIAMSNIAILYALMRTWMRSLKSILNTAQFQTSDLRVR